MPTAIPTVEPLLPDLFCVDGVGVEVAEVEVGNGVTDDDRVTGVAEPSFDPRLKTLYGLDPGQQLLFF